MFNYSAVLCTLANRLYYRLTTLVFGARQRPVLPAVDDPDYLYHPATDFEKRRLMNKIQEGYCYTLSGSTPDYFCGAPAARSYIDTCCSLGRPARLIEESIHVYTFEGPVNLTLVDCAV